jgi:hypothetical protein
MYLEHAKKKCVVNAALTSRVMNQIYRVKSSFLGQFVSYKENEELWIQPLILSQSWKKTRTRLIPSTHPPNFIHIQNFVWV